MIEPEDALRFEEVHIEKQIGDNALGNLAT
jgi:hypothetical protein